MKPTLKSLALALLPLFGAASVSAATVTWIGPNGGSWHIGNNWQNLALPTALDHVQLGAFDTQIVVNFFGSDSMAAASVTGTGTLLINTSGSNGLTLTGNSFLGGLTLEGGSFRNSATTAISGSLTWRDGNLLGPGTTRVEGSATLNLANGPLLTGGHTLVLKGSTSAQTLGFSSQNSLVIENARLVNEGTWLDQASDDTSFKNVNAQLLGVGNFDNAGSFNKSSATVTTFERGVLFNNSGTVNVNAGTLRILGGGSSTGSFTVAEGATLAFGNGPTYALGAAVTNAGTVTINGNVNAAQGLQLAGNIAVNAGELSLGAVSSFANLSLNLFGAINSSSTLLVTGSLDWTGGLFNGSGSARSTGTLLLSGSDAKLIGPGKILVVAGSALQTGTGRLVIGGGVQNLGTWSEQATGNNVVDGIGSFENLRFFNKDSAFVTTVGGNGLLFINRGTVNVNAGTLQLASNFNNRGLINIASGAELDGAHASFANAGTLAGSGTVRALDTLTNTGILAPGGVGQIGQLQVLGNLTTSGGLQVDLSRSGTDLLAVSGNANLGGTLNFSVLDGQRLQRGSSFTVMSWGNRSAGTEFASLDFSQLSGYRFTTAYGATGLSVTVTAVPFNWTGAAAGGFWDVTNNWNDGTDGRPQAGDTVLLGSADTRIRTTQSAGDITGTGRLRLDSGSDLFVSGNGSVGGLALLQGNLTNQGRLVASGASSWVGTTLRGSGGVTRIEGSLAITGNDNDPGPNLVNQHTLELAGTTTFTARRGLSLGDGATVINQGSWVDEAPITVTVGNFNGGTGRFLNQGSFTKASNTRTLFGEGTSMVFESTGSIHVDAGTLRLSSSRVSSTGTINIAAGAELSLVSADATLGGSVLNAGTLSLDGGLLAIAGDLALQGQGLTRLRSQVSNSGLLTVDGSVDWSTGELRGAGTTRMNGAVTLSTGNTGLRSGQTLELDGTTTRAGTDGNLSTGGGARIHNIGTWVESADRNTFVGNFGGGVNSRFDNAGRFNKTSTSITEIGAGLNFHNTGTLDVQAGTLRLSDSGSLTAGQVQIAGGATLELHGGSIELKGTLQNAGTLALTGATVLVTDSATLQGGLSTFKSGAIANTGQLRMTGKVDWFGGDMRGSGTTRIEGDLALRGGVALRNGQTLELAGNTTQIEAGGLQTSGGARLLNLGHWVEAASGNVSMLNGGGALSRFDNQGSFTKTSAFATTIGGGLVLNNTGTIKVQAGTLRVGQDFNNQGLLNVAAGAAVESFVLDFANAGTLAGDGTVRAVSAFDRLRNSGTLAAGGLNDAGTLSLVGGLTQETSGIFLVDLGSTAAGGFDVLTISGAASLTGTLAVNLLDGAHFNVGDSFTVMTWNQRLGNSQFASLDLSQAGGYGFATDYGANSLTLRVTTAVPEPGSWALMAAGLLGLGACTRRRAAQA